MRQISKKNCSPWQRKRAFNNQAARQFACLLQLLHLEQGRIENRLHFWTLCFHGSNSPTPPSLAWRSRRSVTLGQPTQSCPTLFLILQPYTVKFIICPLQSRSLEAGTRSRVALSGS